MHGRDDLRTHGISLGVAGSDGGGGRLINVGAFVAIVKSLRQLLCGMVVEADAKAGVNVVQLASCKARTLLV